MSKRRIIICEPNQELRKAIQDWINLDDRIDLVFLASELKQTLSHAHFENVDEIYVATTLVTNENNGAIKELIELGDGKDIYFYGEPDHRNILEKLEAKDSQMIRHILDKF